MAAQNAGEGEGTPEQPYRLSTIVVTGEPVGQPQGGGAVTVLSGATLLDKSVATPRTLTAVIPNLTVFDANGDRLPRFSVRGLRENNFGYGEAAATVYLDGVPFYDSFSRGLPLYNVETAEFLHGPQGTLYGASRPGGVLNLYTSLPGRTWEGTGRVGVGNYEAASIAASASGPLAPDRLAGGVDLLFSRRDGYFHNLTLDTHPDARRTAGGRVQFHWTPSDQVDVTAAVNLYDYDDGALVARPLNSTDGFYDLRQDYDGSNQQDSQTFSLRAAWRGESVRVVNVAAYRLWEQELDGDFDFTPFPILVGFDRPELSQWSEELRLESAGIDRPLSWSAGLFASGRDVERENGYTYGLAAGPLAGATQLTQSETRDLDLALFGQLIWSPVDPLDLTAGVRGEYDQRDLKRNSVDPTLPPIPTMDLEESFESIQPKLGVNYHWTGSVESWLVVSTGYQPGGFSSSQNDPQRAPFDAAKSLHFELGASGACWEDRFRASVNAFWIETQDYQVYRPVTPTSYEVLNAERARTVGAELELRLQPMRELDLRVVAGLAHAEFTDFAAPDPVSGGTLDLEGRTVNFVPEFTLDASVTYRHAAGWFGTVGGTVVGAYWFDELNTAKQSTYALLHARAGWSDGRFEVACFGRNMLEEEYFANVLDLGAFFPAGQFVGTPGDPAIFGAEISARF